MKLRNRILVLALATAFTLSADSTLAQSPDAQKTRQRTATASQQSENKDPNKVDQKVDQKQVPAVTANDRLEPDDATRTPADVPDDTQAKRVEQISEEAAVEPYYNNFFTTYRLGPEDVISVSVFGQERYSRQGITIPPNGRISLSLIPGGVFVNGKTVYEVSEIIKKRYDEYIIDPQVDVSLDKASSYRYSILGDVGSPGIRMMTHRMTVTEALAEAGGVTSTGNKSKVMVLRRQPNGTLSPIAVNVAKIYKGETPDTVYLVPGDQILVPGNKWKTFQKIMSLSPILSFARIFSGGAIPY